MLQSSDRFFKPPLLLKFSPRLSSSSHVVILLLILHNRVRSTFRICFTYTSAIYAHKPCIFIYLYTWTRVHVYPWYTHVYSPLPSSPTHPFPLILLYAPLYRVRVVSQFIIVFQCLPRYEINNLAPFFSRIYIFFPLLLSESASPRLSNKDAIRQFETNGE